MTDTPERPASLKTVRVRLKDGSVKVYQYPRKPKKPSKRLADRGHGFRSIAHAYTNSPEFKGLSESWQAATRYYLGILEDRLDWMSLKDFNDRESRGDFYEIRDSFASTPTKADKVIGALATVLAWAYERGMIEVNHAREVKKLAPQGGRADKVWTPDQLAALLANSPPDLSKLVRMALLTAARLGDLLALTWEQFDGRWIEYTPAKTAKTTGVIVRLPVYELPPLESLMRELGPSTGHMLRTEARGIPWTIPNFNAKWKAALAKAELLSADRHFHDLRGTAITNLLSAGATDAETASISGHSVGGKSMLRVYAARTDELAIGAYRKLNAALSTRPVVLPLTKRPDKNRGGG